MVNPIGLVGWIGMQMFTHALLLVPNVFLPCSVFQTRWVITAVRVVVGEDAVYQKSLLPLDFDHLWNGGG